MGAVNEEWRPIADFPNYAVSDCGRVMNVQRNQIKAVQFNPYNGYEHISLWDSGDCANCYIHRLVALAFIGPPIGVMDVNHKDGNKRNNFVENLEWMTRSENQLHAYRTGVRGPFTPHNKRTIVCLETGQAFESIKECGDLMHIRPSSISNYLAGRRRDVFGYTFEYVEG